VKYELKMSAGICWPAKNKGERHHMSSQQETKTIEYLFRAAADRPYPSAIDLPRGLANLSITAVVHDSRQVVPGSLFVAIKGHASDGHEYLSAAFEAGAVAAVTQDEVADIDPEKLIKVDDSRVALAWAAARFYDNPSQSLAISGVTGTNGKTTTIYLLDAIARAAAEQSGVIGTVESKYSLPENPHTGLSEECAHSTATTTPDALQLQSLFAEMRDAGVQSVAMEVSSHAIDMHRVEQTTFAAVAFTNLSQDHLDYHNTMEEYRRVKERLFTDFDTKARVINIDDQVGANLAARLKLESYEVVCVGINEPSIEGLSLDVTATELVQGSERSEFLLVTPSGRARVSFPLVGKYNVENALVAAGCAWSRGISPEIIADGLSDAAQVPGRLEQVEAGQDFKVFVDYAHTPDALSTALAAVREQTPGRVIAVFGCGGDRDPMKRPLMAAAASSESDYVVVTSDNPRSEDPAGIVANVLEGICSDSVKCDAIVDRREAIFHAVALAKEGDSILIAGKGHEDYQIFADRTIHFDDREVARAALDCRCGSSLVELGAGT
jgi:UDP-N-acetylmuramoyl-L-alanyl-D-glutamate--2,6-diaminopimelate ligase